MPRGRGVDHRGGYPDPRGDFARHEFLQPSGEEISRRSAVRKIAGLTVGLTAAGVLIEGAIQVANALHSPFEYGPSNPDNLLPTSINLGKTRIQIADGINLRQTAGAYGDKYQETVISWGDIATIGGKDITGAKAIVVEDLLQVKQDADGIWYRLQATDKHGHSGYAYVVQGPRTRDLVQDLDTVPQVGDVLDVESGIVTYTDPKTGNLQTISANQTGKVVQVIK